MPGAGLLTLSLPMCVISGPRELAIGRVTEQSRTSGLQLPWASANGMTRRARGWQQAEHGLPAPRAGLHTLALTLYAFSGPYELLIRLAAPERN